MDICSDLDVILAGHSLMYHLGSDQSEVFDVSRSMTHVDTVHVMSYHGLQWLLTHRSLKVQME